MPASRIDQGLPGVWQQAAAAGGQRAARGDHWLHLHAQAPAALQASIKQHLFKGFFVNTPHWKRYVMAEVCIYMMQALDGLDGLGS